MPDTTFADRLRSLRQQSGLSVAELAERAGLQRTHVHQLESGVRASPQLHTLQKLARALGKDGAKLLS